MADLSRLEYLQAMGVDVYVRRHSVLDVDEDTAEAVALSATEPTASHEPVASAVTPPVQQTPVTQPAQAGLQPPDSLQSDRQELGAQLSSAEEYAALVSAPVEGDSSADTKLIPSNDDRNDVSGLDWQALTERVSQCQACGLADGRTQTVFGVGNQQADVLVIGEAPGQEEDLRGEPFVGRVGQLLDAMLVAVGLSRQQVFIANLLKCQPPNNRDAEVTEIEACHAYLQRQIELLQPKVILVVGRVAAQNLLNTEQAIGRLRGSVHTLGESQIPVIATYHPDHLLHQPSQKEKSWQDLQLLMRFLSEVA